MCDDGDERQQRSARRRSSSEVEKAEVRRVKRRGGGAWREENESIDAQHATTRTLTVHAAIQRPRQRSGTRWVRQRASTVRLRGGANILLVESERGCAEIVSDRAVGAGYAAYARAPGSLTRVEV